MLQLGSLCYKVPPGLMRGKYTIKPMSITGVYKLRRKIKERGELSSGLLLILVKH